MGLKSDLVTVQELAKAFGVSVATVDHYVDIGLLKITTRQGTQRLFDRRICYERIKMIQELLSKGILLKEIRQQINGAQITPAVKKSIVKKILDKRIIISLILLASVWAILSFLKDRR
jgi:DNA-binding transcriptional MerR regulator